MKQPDSILINKWQELLQKLKSYPRLGVALSGGVDSALTLAAVVEAIGAQNAAAFTIQSPLEFPEEVHTAQQISNQLGVAHVIIPWNDLLTPGFVKNPTDRCYLCKRQRLSLILTEAKKMGINTMCDGSNLDDAADFRPGRRALQELEIISPLALAGLTKNEVRQLANCKNLPVWDKPSMPCLATRIPYGTPIQMGDIERIGAGELVLQKMGFSPVRLRLHGQVTRAEISPEQFADFIKQREEIIRQLEPLELTYLSLDLVGFRSGSLNKGIT